MRYKRPREGEEVPVSFLAIEERSIQVWIASKRAPVESFPPCIRNILTLKSSGRGGYRASAVLAAFLGQAGWPEEEAKELWARAAEEMGLAREERIFRKWFQHMHCPGCRTIKTKARGYPHLGLAGLDYCQPDDRCSEYAWPVGYATGVSGEDMEDERGRRMTIRTVRVARLHDWSTGSEVEVEMTDEEAEELESLLSGREDEQLFYTTVRVRGRPRPRFLLKSWEEPRRWILSEKL